MQFEERPAGGHAGSDAVRSGNARGVFGEREGEPALILCRQLRPFWDPTHNNTQSAGSECTGRKLALGRGSRRGTFCSLLEAVGDNGDARATHGATHRYTV